MVRALHTRRCWFPWLFSLSRSHHECRFKNFTHFMEFWFNFSSSIYICHESPWLVRCFPFYIIKWLKVNSTWFPPVRSELTSPPVPLCCSYYKMKVRALQLILLSFRLVCLSFSFFQFCPMNFKRGFSCFLLRLVKDGQTRPPSTK